MIMKLSMCFSCMIQNKTTMERKFTKGDWIFKQTGNANEFQIITDENKWVVAFRLNGEQHLEEETANAKLLAAAPVLLKALENLVHLHNCEMEGLQSGKPTMQQWLDAVDEAVEAIQKATK